MPRLFIHIGTPKTGSTAIQYFLAQNIEALDAQGVNFVRQGRKRDAHNLVLQARRAGELTKVTDKIADEIRARPDDTHILTSEMYFGAGLGRDLADALPDDIREGARILVYLRRQDRFLEALYKQRVKTGRYSGDAWAFAQSKLGNGNYARALAPWAEAFGQANIIVRPFERPHFPNGNVVHDAAAIFGIRDLDQLFVPGSIDNLSLSHEITRLLGRIGQSTDINIKDVVRHLSHDPPADAARSNDCFSKDQRLELLAQFTECNAMLRERYCPDLEQMFDDRDLAPDAPDPLPDATERLERMERAQEIVFDAIAQMRAGA